MNCGVWRVQCEVWSVKFGVWRKQGEVRSVDCEVWSVKFGVQRVQCEVWSVKSAVWSVQCEGSSGKWEVWSVKFKFGVRRVSVKCEVWSVKAAVRSEKCEVWTVKCGVWSAKWEVWSLECEGSSEKCEVWTVKCEVRSEKCEVWSLECEGSSEKCEVWTVKCGLWSVECEVRSEKEAVGSEKCELWSVKCGVWSVKFKFGVRRAQCEVWSVRFGVWRQQREVRSEKCGVRSVECEVWSFECEECSVKCGVRSVECEDFASSLAEKKAACRGKDTVGTGWRRTIGHLCLGNFRRRLARVYVNACVNIQRPCPVCNQCKRPVPCIQMVQPLWSQTRTTVKWRLRVFDAALNTKLLYGLETIQLTRSEQNTLDAFQMKMLRRILRVPSTYIDREWTNQRVIDTLTQRFGYKHVGLSTRWKQNKIRLLGHIFRSSPQDPMREVLFETGTFFPRIEHTGRVGKPRAHWLLETCQDAYALIDPTVVVDMANQQHMLNLATVAQRRLPPFHTRKNT